MINSADLQNYRNGEFIQFLLTVVNKSNELNATTLGIATQVNDLDAKTQSMDALYKPNTGSDISPEIAALDYRRDRAIVGIRTVAEGFISHFDETKKQAGLALVLAIDHYGTRISAQNYVEETTIIRAIVNDFETQPALINHLNLLGIQDWVQEMKVANNQFQTQYENRINETATQITSLDTYRLECQAVYRTLVNHINSHEVLNPSENINLLVARINQTISQYNQIVSNRSGAGETEENN